MPEGVHKPLGRYIFNNMNMNRLDPLVTILRNAGYYIFDHPTDATGVIVRIPVEYGHIPFDRIRKLRRGAAKIGERYVLGDKEVTEEEATFVVDVNE